MSTEQSAPDSGPSIESRMAAVFTAESAPEVAPEPVVEAAAENQQVEPETDDGEDFELDGLTYRLPADLKAKVSELKEGALRREDYTRKTQELAEMHRQVSTMAETAQARQQFEQSITSERTELERVKADMARYKGLDWGSLDIDAHLKLRTQLEQLKERSGELEREINTKAGQFAQWSEGKKRELIQQGTKFLSQTIKGWGPETVRDVASAAQEVGYTSAEIENVFDVRFVRLAHKAAQYDKLMAGKPAALATAQKAPPVIKPGASKGPGAEVGQRVKDARQALRKSGSLDDAARLFRLRG